MGTQDSLYGAIDGHFVVALGNRGNDGTGPQHGMWNGGWSLDMRDPQARWRALPTSPSSTAEPCGGHLPCQPNGYRRGMSVSSAAHVRLPPALGGGEGPISAGGFSHTQCSNESFLLRRNNGTTGFEYTALPSLPYDLGTGALTAVGSRARGVGATEAGLLRDGEPSLWDLGLFIFDNASPGAAAAIERLRHQTLERLGQQSQDMAQEHAAAESASRPAESSRR